MRQSRSEVPSGIDGVASGAAKGKPDSPHQCGYQVWTQSGRWTRIGHRFGKNRAYHQDKNESSQDLTHEVRAKSADRRRSAETREFEGLIGSLCPVRHKMKPDENCTRERTC